MYSNFKLLEFQKMRLKRKLKKKNKLTNLNSIKNFNKKCEYQYEIVTSFFFNFTKNQKISRNV